MLDACVASLLPENACIEALTHHFAAGGSRLRARICLDASFHLNLSEPDGLCIAVACELLHNASLVHDDLLDRAPVRRGKPAIWARFGDGTAVCAGDLMLGSAYAALAGLSAVSLLPAVLALVHKRTSEVIAGEAAELAAADLVAVTPEAYEEIARGKSASLLSLALELPLCVAGRVDATPLARAVASRFAAAYQMVDDLDDVAQDQLSHSLNIVTVLQRHKTISQAEAEALAASRARQLSVEAVQLAGSLPANCAAVLVHHAKALTKRLSAVRAAAVPALQG